MADVVPFASADERARRRIAESLDESLLVEAAAGTGKTTALVRRLVAVLGSGRTTVDRVVAVTFTKKAAGELKLRLRQELDRERTAAVDSDRQEHLGEAIARLEEARIGTIHAFCAEILRERPVEAGVDPGFLEMDDGEAQRLYDGVFNGWVERRLDDMPEGLRRASARLAHWRGRQDRSPLDRLRAAGWGLVDWRDHRRPWQRRPFERKPLIDQLVKDVTRLAGWARESRQPRDPLRRTLEDVIALADWLERAEAVAERDYDELEARLVGLAWGLTWNRKKVGRGAFAEGISRQRVLAAREALYDAVEELELKANADLAAVLYGELAEVTDGYERAKRRAGRLDFLDLLLKVRQLLAGDAAVRRSYQKRFSHLFVDEVQDTDPLQAEIILLLAADDPDQADPWRARPVPGKLFLVGDPKQSIYRFRRADVLLYQRLKEKLAGDGVAVVHLTRSFRAVESLQQVANAAFAPLMTGDAEVGQPEYVPLSPSRDDLPDQPAVVVLPVPDPWGWYGVTRGKVEAGMPEVVASFVAWLVEESGWRVGDPEGEGTVPIRPRHIAVLFRRFLSFTGDVTRGYLQEFEARGIPHLLIGGRSFHQREEVETLRAALAAVEWPDDELSVFATLKGALFAIPDDLLLRYRHRHGSLHPFRRPEMPASGGDQESADERPGDDLEQAERADQERDPAAADELPVIAALALLADLHRRRNRVPIATTVNRLLEATRAHAAFALRPAGRQVLANIARIADLARTFEITGGLSFRGFVERLEAEAEGWSSTHAPALEEGAEGVRVMTLHNAKGLEFPVVILADPTARLARDDPDRHVDGDLAATRILGWTPWELLDHADLEVARDRAEGVRIAYVAATRARDLLVVPGVGAGLPDDWNGWLDPLDRAVYPPPERRRQAEEAPGSPPPGGPTVLAEPSNPKRQGERPIAAGAHRPEAGDHRVVWWDPARLQLAVEGRFGVRQEHVLAEDPGGQAAAAGLERYRAWRQGRQQVIERAGTPRFTVRPVTELEAGPPATADPPLEDRIEVVRLPRPAGRPGGIRFGTLVHQLLRDVPLPREGEAERRSEEVGERLARLATFHARLIEAPDEEVAAAIAAVEKTLAHPLLRRAATARRTLRESPFLLPLGEGVMVEGTVDLAFLELDESGDDEPPATWTVVDYKTDPDLEPALPGYRQQLAWYLFALEELTGVTARGVILGV